MRSSLIPSVRNQRGFAHHFLAPVLAIAAVGAIGGIVALRISGASSPCGATISATQNTKGNCVGYAQQMINGSLAYMYARSSSANTINNWPISKLGADNTFDVTNGFSGVSRNYSDSITAGWVKDIQNRMVGNNSEFCQYLKLPTCAIITQRTALQATATIDQHKTWYALCQVTDQIRASGWNHIDNATDFTSGQPDSGGTNKTNMWYIRSYMRTGITAASDAGCSNITSSTTTSNQPPKVAPAALTTSVTSSTLTVTWAAVSNATKYQVLVAGPTGSTRNNVIVTATKATINVNVGGTNGTVKVRAGNATGWGPWSANKTFTATSGGGTGTPPPTSGTNAMVNFDKNLNVPALNEYSIGDTLSTYGGTTDNVANPTWRGTLAALGPLAWRVPLRDTNGTPTGAGGGGGGTGYVQDIHDMGGVPVVIAAGQGGDNDFNDTQIQALANYYNAGGGRNGGPVNAWIVGNEPSDWGTYKGDVDGVINAIKAGSPGVPLTFSAGAVPSQSSIGSLSDLLGLGDSSAISYLSWHAYQGGDNNGSNSGQYAGPLYESEEQQAVSAAKGKPTALEEFNWNAGCNNGQYPEFNTWKNELFITSVIGNILAGGGSHAYMYADSNGCGTLSDGGNDGGITEGTQLPAYWALGMWTGMNREFDRFGSHLVDSSVAGVDVQNASGKENTKSLAYNVELFATDNGKILAINKDGTNAHAITIGIGGYTSGKYNVWQSHSKNINGTTSNIGSDGKPTEVATNQNFSGSKITVTLPAGSVSSIDVQ